MNEPSAKSRGRPRQAAADEKEMRERIAAVARELFLREGVDAVSMRNIASEVGCSPMWLYRYFDNKQEILWHVWDMILDELFDRLGQIKTRSPRARLEKLALCYLDYWLEYPERFLIVFLQPDLEQGATRSYVENSDRLKYFDLFTHTVEKAQAQGELGSSNAASVAQGLMCVLQGLALNFITISDYPWADIASLKRLTVKSYLSGLASSDS
ncbi:MULTISPECIES: TetR/AcrR family transcriptional regulator [unclassified Variovorax]|uniref:TetR/AcrR family transcriptional regulator n=1 Tax=unclassified Variovorax TaxID=663243 RepID=UPI0034E94532